MKTLQTMNTRPFSVAIGPYQPGPDPRVHGHDEDLKGMLGGIGRRHGGLTFGSKDEADGALWGAYMARLAGIRSRG